MIQLLPNLFVLTAFMFNIMDLLDVFKSKLNDMVSLLHDMSEIDRLSAISLWEKTIASSQGFLPNKGGSTVQSLFGLDFVGSDSLISTNVTPFVEESGDVDDADDDRTDTSVQDAIPTSVGSLLVDSVEPANGAVGDRNIDTEGVPNTDGEKITSQEQKITEEITTEEGETLEAEVISQSLLKQDIDMARSKDVWTLAGENCAVRTDSAVETVAIAGEVATKNNNSGSGGKMTKKMRKRKSKKEKRQVVKQTKEEKCTCEVCGKALANPSNLRVHMRVHNGVRPYKCSICDKSFSIRPNMRRHEKTHSGEKPWECTQCLKRFTEKKSLKVHFRSHTGEKPFECKDCGKCFTQAGTLQSHMHVHTGWKGHLCDFCGKSFRQKSQLRLHEFRHTNNRRYVCQVCTRSFISKGELDRHSMQHTGERPYLCTLCPKMFTRLTYLKEHMNSHTGQKPYLCPHCSETFHERSVFSKHVKRHEAARNVDRNHQQVELHTVNSEFGGKDTYLLYISPPPVLGMLSSQVDEVVAGIDDRTTTEDAVISIPVLSVKDNNFSDDQQVAAAMPLMATSDGLESVLETSEKFVFVKTGDKIPEHGEDGTEQYAMVELLETPS